MRNRLLGADIATDQTKQFNTDIFLRKVSRSKTVYITVTQVSKFKVMSNLKFSNLKEFQLSSTPALAQATHFQVSLSFSCQLPTLVTVQLNTSLQHVDDDKAGGLESLAPDAPNQCHLAVQVPLCRLRYPQICDIT
jgi:hypothetical protein